MIKPSSIFSVIEMTGIWQGPQIIVEIKNIELTSQNSTYTNDSWQLGGQLNENIAAVAVFAPATAVLPRELADEISYGTDDWPMGIEEAAQYRQELIREHTWNEAARCRRMPGPAY
ncbi:hypothetical protein PENCOP_c004G03081 [Penicillium coprophilum]|uniref:DUF4246 domain-containing protein n=1 Tax=Penicillium coprophilum TaxID=36646 RepID=A0A1V6UUE7_9EURO|nr:hypothetical protein PENCOP_c004G03081 [Penicillium coprophilum]